MFTYGRQCRRIKRGRRRLQTRPTPLLGLLYCQRLRPRATERTAAYNVIADISCNNSVDCQRILLFYGSYSAENLVRNNTVSLPDMVCAAALPCINLDHDFVHIYSCLLPLIHSICEKSLL